MKKFILLVINMFIGFSFLLHGQNMMSKEQFIEQLSEKYDSYKESNIKHRRFKHTDLKPLIENFKKNNLFKVSILGNSIEGRTIPLISLGTGKTKILMWSQMHGDESTATMALFDIFNFFSQSDEFDILKKDFLDKVTLYCIPMPTI